MTFPAIWASCVATDGSIMEIASNEDRKIRVLYSFPHKLGAGRICWTAWQQVMGLDAAGVKVTALAGSYARKPPSSVRLVTTLGVGRLRIPYRLLGITRAARIHDYLTARWLKANAGEIDIVHGWPLGALNTVKAARDLGIPVVLERPNCHTEFAYAAVEEECRRMDLVLPAGSEHKFDPDLLAHENLEYAGADFLLCPSEFVKKTFLDRGYPESKLLRHQYGYDDCKIFPGNQTPKSNKGLVMIYAGLCAPRKGLHHALKAWLASEASKTGRFLVCGEFVDVYRDKISNLFDHPSIEVLGHRDDLPDLMAMADLFVLSSVEEGSALVTYEARGAGCVLLVSDASGAVCRHMENALVHRFGDVGTLASHIDTLHRDRELLARLREESLKELPMLTWLAAGKKLRDVYAEAIRLTVRSNER
jgi:glycosyltransferase involved in cell wall biosynthesis